MTFLEVIVWVAVFTSAMLAISQSILYFYRANNYTIQQASAITSAQRGLEHFVRTVREASYASDGAYPIVSMGLNDVTFYAEIDGDSAIERVHFYVVDTGLYRGVLEPSGNPLSYTGTEATSTISDYVRNITLGAKVFSYYDENGVEITDFTRIAEVRFISANLIVNIDPNKLPDQLTLRSSAALRNIK